MFYSKNQNHINIVKNFESETQKAKYEILDTNTDFVLAVGVVVGATDCGTSDAWSLLDKIGDLGEYPNYRYIQNLIYEVKSDFGFNENENINFNYLMDAVLNLQINKIIEDLEELMLDLDYTFEEIEFVTSWIGDNQTNYCNYLDSSFYIPDLDYLTSIIEGYGVQTLLEEINDLILDNFTDWEDLTTVRYDATDLYGDLQLSDFFEELKELVEDLKEEYANYTNNINNWSITEDVFQSELQAFTLKADLKHPLLNEIIKKYVG